MITQVAENQISLSDLREKNYSFSHKTVGQRSAIVFAGPAANFLFAITILAVLFTRQWVSLHMPAEVGSVKADSAAEKAGLRAGDKFIEINGQRIQRFEEVQQIIRLAANETLQLRMVRSEKKLQFTLLREITTLKDRSGNMHKIGMLVLADRAFLMLGMVL